MKKLMIATMTAGLAVGAFAAYAPIVELKTIELDFEDGTADSSYNFGDDAVNWVNIAGKNTVKAYEPPAEGKYLHLDTDGEDVYRAFDNPANWGAGTTNSMTMGGNLWIDTMVKFTASESAPALDAGAKFALWLKEIEGETESTYELHALCGAVDGGGNTTPTDIVLEADVTPAEWHRLVIRPDWEGGYVDIGFFTVTLDGVPLAAAEGTVLVADPTVFTSANQALIAARRLLPSRVNGTDDASQIAAVGFNGTGDIDDFIITDQDPYYIPVTSIELNETSAAVGVGETVKLAVTSVLPLNATKTNIVWTSSADGVATVDQTGLVTGVSESETPITITATVNGGEALATCAVKVTASSINVVVPTSEMWTATVDPASGKAGDTITVTYTANNGKLFKDGKPTLVRTGTLNPDGSIAFNDGVDTDTEDAKASIGSVLFLTLNAAIEAVQAGETVKMLADVTAKVNIPAGKVITLDFNGHAINSVGFGIYNRGTLTIENGNITAKEGSIVLLGNSTTTINGGSFKSLDNAVIMGQGNLGNDNVKLTINGGTFTSGITTDGYIACGIYVANGGTYAINGGTFNITDGCGICARAGEVKVAREATFNVSGTKTGKVGDKNVQVPCVDMYIDYSEPPYPGYQVTDYLKAQDNTLSVAEGFQWSAAADEGGYYKLEEVPPTPTYTVTFSTNTVVVAEQTLENVKSGTTLAANQIPNFGEGTWDVQPLGAIITSNTNFNFTVKAKVDPEQQIPVPQGKTPEQVAEDMNTKGIENYLNVPTVVTDKATYTAMFAAKPDGKGAVIIDLKTEVEAEIKAQLADTATSGSMLNPAADKVTITARPGLFYGIKAVGDVKTIGAANAQNWVQASGTTVNVVRPTVNGNAAFFQAVCSPKAPTANQN